MAYAALADLVARAGAEEILQVADRDGSGAADPEVVAAALRHATTTIDAYLAARYALPLAPVPEVVRGWAVALARHWLHRDGPPEHVRQDHEDAMAALKDAARGTLVLPGAGSAVPPAAGAVLAAHPPQIFSAEALRGWR
jgi:phage gp36-like protein